MQNAYNPKTGEYIFSEDGKEWFKPTRSAVNPKTGETAFEVNGMWEIVGAPPKKETELDMSGELKKGAQLGVESIKALPNTLSLYRDTKAVKTYTDQLAAYDKVDKGIFSKDADLSERRMYPAAVRSYMNASDEKKQELRAQALGKIQEKAPSIQESMQLYMQFVKDTEKYKAKTEKLTDVENAKEFGNWLGHTFGSSAVQLAPTMLAAITTGGLGAFAVGTAMSMQETMGNRIGYIQERVKGLPPKEQADAIIAYLEKTGNSTALISLASGSLDLFGPVGAIVRKRLAGEGFKDLTLGKAGKEIGKQTGEEALTGAGQESVQIGGEFALKEQAGDVFSKKNVKRVIDASAQEAAGGFLGASANVGARGAKNAYEVAEEKLAPERVFARAFDDVVKGTDFNPQATRREAALRMSADIQRGLLPPESRYVGQQEEQAPPTAPVGTPSGEGLPEEDLFGATNIGGISEDEIQQQEEPITQQAPPVVAPVTPLAVAPEAPQAIVPPEAPPVQQLPPVAPQAAPSLPPIDLAPASTAPAIAPPALPPIAPIAAQPTVNIAPPVINVAPQRVTPVTPPVAPSITPPPAPPVLKPYQPMESSFGPAYFAFGDEKGNKYNINNAGDIEVQVAPEFRKQVGNIPTVVFRNGDDRPGVFPSNKLPDFIPPELKNLFEAHVETGGLNNNGVGFIKNAVQNIFENRETAQKPATVEVVTPGITKETPEQRRMRIEGAKEEKDTPSKNLIRLITELGGIDKSLALDIAGDKGMRGLGPAGLKLFRTPQFQGSHAVVGFGVDELARKLVENGWMSPQELQDVDGGAQRAKDLVRDALDGRLQPVKDEDIQKSFDRRAAEEAARYEEEHNAAVADAMATITPQDKDYLEAEHGNLSDYEFELKLIEQAKLRKANNELASLEGNEEIIELPKEQPKALPKDLAGAAPRYSYGPRKYTLNFDNDIDKAAYIAAQQNPSSRDADYVSFVSDATGMTEPEVRAHGAAVKAAIKDQAKSSPAGTLTVPTIFQNVAVTTPQIGELVKLQKPGIGGPVNIAGTVTKIMPNGNLEIRTQQDGYLERSPKDVTRQESFLKSQTKEDLAAKDKTETAQDTESQKRARINRETEVPLMLTPPSGTVSGQPLNEPRNQQSLLTQKAESNIVATDQKKPSAATKETKQAEISSDKAFSEMDSLPKAAKKLPPGRSPELSTAAQNLKEGKISQAEYDNFVNKYRPIPLYTEPLTPATPQQVYNALDIRKREKINPVIPENKEVGLRLDIPAWNNHKTFVVTIHEKRSGFSRAGGVIGYASAAAIKDVKFAIGNQSKSLEIAAGKSKDALQTMEGKYVPMTPEQVYQKSKDAISSGDWVQIGFDPTRHAYFYDRRTTLPVVSAKEILQIGNMILGKGVEFGSKENFLYNLNTEQKFTEEELAVISPKIREEQIRTYAGLRRRIMSAAGKVAAGEVSTDLQRRLIDLIDASKDLKFAIEATRPVKSSPQTFMAKALSEYDKGNISAEVLGVIEAAYSKYPELLEGLRLSVVAPKSADSQSAGNFESMSRIVRLFKTTSGVENSTTIRHELTHSLEQMMTNAQRQAVYNAWLKDLQKAVKNAKGDKAKLNYLEAVINFIENPSRSNHEKAMELIPSYDMYQFINPSEYWAVNAEKLLGSQLGGAWQRFKLFVKRLFEGLKSVLGFDNQYPVHKVFNQIMSGEKIRISHSQLVDMVTNDIDFKNLNNRKDDLELVDKYNRAKTPMIDKTPIKNALITSKNYLKNTFKDFSKGPIQASMNFGNSVDRGITYLRNKNIWFGTGLNLEDQKKYGGMLRDSDGMAVASMALDNALRGGNIAAQVVLQGGIKWNAKSLNFVATKTNKGMVGVYKAEKVLQDRLGDQLATDIINGYLEAKRSLSIRNESSAAEAALVAAENNFIIVSTDPASTKAKITSAKNQVAEAKDHLVSVKVALSKVAMSEEEQDAFIAREKAHPELKDIMENWTAINQNLLRFWKQVGMLSEGRYKTLSGIKDYVPWQRIMNDEEDIHSPNQTTTKSMTNIGREKLYKKGAPVNIIDFIAEKDQTSFEIPPSRSVVVEVNGKTIPESEYTISRDGEVELLRKVNKGDLIVFKGVREIDNIIDNMTKNVMRMTMNGLRQHAANRIVKDYATRNANGKIMTFVKDDPSMGRINWIANGRRVVIEIKDPLVRESMIGMESLNLTMFKPLIAAANFTRRAITLSGAFQLKQVFKDAPTAALVTGVKRPDLLIGGAYKGFITALTNTDPVVDILRAAGIGGFHSPSRTPEAEVKKRIGVMNKNVYDVTMSAIDHFGDSSDMAQRVATYKRVLAETGDEAQALYAAANVINFLRHGSSQLAQTVVKTVPFMGAYANSIDVLYTALAGGGLKGKDRASAIKQIAITGTLLAMTTLAYCMMVSGDKDYEELDDDTKLRNVVIPGTSVMLPMNTSAAFGFFALTVSVYNYVTKHGTEKEVDRRRLIQSISRAFMDSHFGPEPVPSLIKPFVEITLKHNFFTGREITPKSLENLDKAQQYTATTSEAGKYLSSKLSVAGQRAINPIEADHLIRSLTGSIGGFVQWYSNVLGEASENRVAMSPKQYPFVGAFIKPEVPRGNLDLFYDFKNVVENKNSTFESYIRQGKTEQAKAYGKENEAIIGWYDYVQEMEKDINETNALIREIGESSDKKLTPKLKAEYINILQKAKNAELAGIEKIRKSANLPNIIDN
jgi:hypothetical protein